MRRLVRMAVVVWIVGVLAMLAAMWAESGVPQDAANVAACIGVHCGALFAVLAGVAAWVAAGRDWS